MSAAGIALLAVAAVIAGGVLLVGVLFFGALKVIGIAVAVDRLERTTSKQWMWLVLVIVLWVGLGVFALISKLQESPYPSPANSVSTK